MLTLSQLKRSTIKIFSRKFNRKTVAIVYFRIPWSWVRKPRRKRLMPWIPW